MNAETIAKALGGRKAGGGWMARCPAHDDRKPSLSIRDADDGKVLVRCHAGCDQERVIAALRSRGLWSENASRRFTRLFTRLTHVGCQERQSRIATTPNAARRRSPSGRLEPAEGTLVETYLASRGLHLPPPPTLRFHAGLKHPSGGVWPTMVGAGDARRPTTRRWRSTAPSLPTTVQARPRSIRRR